MSGQNCDLQNVYYMRYRAQNKLQKQAVREEHDLRLMVGHANLLDSIMMKLHDAEEQRGQACDSVLERSVSPESSGDESD